MADNYTKDEKNEVEEKNRDVENRSVISRGVWYENGNNEDV